MTERGVRDDLPEDRQQHLDDQTALANPPGPGASKQENLRRVGRQVEEQRRRRRAATGRPPEPD
jgi:hypothetical protein